MRKKFFAVLIVAVVATFAGYNIYQSQRTVTMSDLALANVEALAQKEGGMNTCRMTPDWYCTFWGSGVGCYCGM
ncbi:MAG: NVEALA domain-containing protein [Bacteroides sp.]|uniref:NVEALA domain-containing protein n=1 Tax=Bacteroides sp. TaxID=29523 RepID=UPI002FCA0E7B